TRASPAPAPTRWPGRCAWSASTPTSGSRSCGRPWRAWTSCARRAPSSTPTRRTSRPDALREPRSADLLAVHVLDVQEEQHALVGDHHRAVLVPVRVLAGRVAVVVHEGLHLGPVRVRARPDQLGGAVGGGP